MDTHNILRESRSTLSTASNTSSSATEPKFLYHQSSSESVNSLGLPSSSPLTRLYKLKPEYAHLRAVHPGKPLRKTKERLKERFATIKERVIDRHDIDIEISKDLHTHEHRPHSSSKYRFPPISPSYQAKMLLEETDFAASHLEVEEVEPGPDGIKALRVTVIYPIASEYSLPTEISDLDREAVWETYFLQMSLYYRASASTPGYGTINADRPPAETREDKINVNKSSRHGEQELTLSLLHHLHMLYDLFELDKHTTANRGLGYYSRVSKRPYDLDGGDWAPYFNPKSFKHILVGRLFDALYSFLTQIHRLQWRVKKGEIWLEKPIDAQWVSKMLLDACRAWDDLCWFEDCFSPTDVPKGKSYCLRPTINHPEAPTSTAGLPGNWIRRLSESVPAGDCPTAPPAVCTAHTEGPHGREPTATESVLQYPHMEIPGPLSKVAFQGGPEAPVKDDVNEHHEIEAYNPSVNGEEKVTEGPIPKSVSVSEIEDEQSVKRQTSACPIIHIAKQVPPHSVAEHPAVLSKSRSGNNNPHAQPCKLNEKTQPKQAIKSIDEDPEAPKLLDAVAKRMITAADKAKMDAFEASFKWASPRSANKKPGNLKHDFKFSARRDYPDSIPSIAGSSGAASSAAPSSSASDPNRKESQAVSTYGPFESAGYAKLPSPCGSFENESYITRLCHNEDNSVHVDEKRNKLKFISKFFKTGGAK